ncbi:hypothetical protein SLEP1_g52493 [Rubroshorea leprosula]|uniref:Uncharacterized protein n=1 Tax=Rubroshorea leprosula TaxID=152421 RepID=A0AAV5M9V7_9ROSI|nr:hypothetical protein SLEP1_g52493 [Rubroshorea leprosula]
MLQNPKCVVAYPNVFREPWAIVAPETMLSLGHKFYVVPKSTVRKLQRMSDKHSPHPMHQSSASEEKESSRVSSTCWFGKISNLKDGCSFSDDKCFKGMISGSKTKGQEVVIPRREEDIQRKQPRNSQRSHQRDFHHLIIGNLS